MAPAKTKKRKQKQSKAALNAFKANGKAAIRTAPTVFLSHVPSALCVSERAVRDLFAEYGTLQSVSIHHNFLDVETDGFMYLEYAEKEEAEAAVAAVKEKSVGFSPSSDLKSKKAVHPSEITGMQAILALDRGEPKQDVDEQVRDILMGKSEVNRFSQSQAEQAMDEDDLILQSLSQHSFANSQPKKKKRKRPKKPDEAATTDKPKKTRKAKSNLVTIPSEL
ncbi:hypothetical protein PRNP1_001264 [Phytophthora ramorum]